MWTDHGWTSPRSSSTTYTLHQPFPLFPPSPPRLTDTTTTTTTSYHQPALHQAPTAVFSPGRQSTKNSECGIVDVETEMSRGCRMDEVLSDEAG